MNNGTKERHEANFAKIGYNFEKDPRFNGAHVALGYDGVGHDPCDPHNHRAWVTASMVPKPPVRQGRGLRRKVN